MGKKIISFIVCSIKMPMKITCYTTVLVVLGRWMQQPETTVLYSPNTYVVYLDFCVIEITLPDTIHYMYWFLLNSCY